MAGWGSSVTALCAALLVVGLTSPASPATATAEGDSAEPVVTAQPQLATASTSAQDADAADQQAVPAATEPVVATGAASTSGSDVAAAPESGDTSPTADAEQDSTEAGAAEATVDLEAPTQDRSTSGSVLASTEPGAEPQSVQQESLLAEESTPAFDAVLVAGTMSNPWCNPIPGTAGTYEQRHSESGSWTSGNAGKAYSEGDWVPQRVQLTGMAAGHNQFVISFGYQNGMTIGYDDARFTRITDASGATIAGATGTVSLSGATPNPSGATTDAHATINFQVPTGGTIWLYYDVHLANSLDYADSGYRGAAYYSGSSLHVGQVSLNCEGLGTAALSIPAGQLAYGTITVDKVTEPAGSPDLFDFTMTDGESSTGFQLADASDPWTSRVGIRTFTITEVDIPASWELSSLVCTGTTPTYDLSHGQVQVPVANKSNITCTFTNTQVARLTLQKTWVGALAGDQTALSISYGSEVATATSVATGATGSWTDTTNRATANVPVGTRVYLAEQVEAGNAGLYEATLTCDGVQLDSAHSFAMPEGEVTCTVTNDRLIPGIQVVKQAWTSPSHDQEIASGSPLVSGTTVHWTYLVTNTGETPLNGVVVTDDQVPAVTCPATTLAVGAQMTCTASGPVTALP